MAYSESSVVAKWQAQDGKEWAKIVFSFARFDHDNFFE